MDGGWWPGDHDDHQVIIIIIIITFISPLRCWCADKIKCQPADDRELWDLLNETFCCYWLAVIISVSVYSDQTSTLTTLLNSDYIVLC